MDPKLKHLTLKELYAKRRDLITRYNPIARRNKALCKQMIELGNRDLDLGAAIERAKLLIRERRRKTKKKIK